MSDYSRPRITWGNDFTIRIALQQFLNGEYVDFNLSTVKSLEVYLICSTHNQKIPLEWELEPGFYYVISCFVDYRVTHPNTSYGIGVEGIDENDNHFRWYMAGKEGILVVTNTSGQNIPQDVEIVDLSGRVGWGIQTNGDLTNYYTKGETEQYVQGELEDYYDKTETNALLDEKANSADLATVATSGSYNDLINKPTIPAAQVQSDYNQYDNTKVDYIKNKPNLSIYATKQELGNYYDKGETDGLLNNKVDTSTLVNDYYNKNTVDNLLDTKADTSDLNNYYDKTETNSLLNQKANTSDLNNKQDTLVSGTNIKTINNQSLLGSGNIDIQGGGGENHDNADEATANALFELNERLSEAEININIIPKEIEPKLNALEENVEQSLSDLTPKFDEIDEEFKSTALVIEELHETTQPTLVSGTNIKTINNESILGSGNITIGGGVQSNWNETDTTSLAYIQNKPTIPEIDIDYSKKYFTIVSLEDNNSITFKAANSNSEKTVYISIDNGNTWTSYVTTSDIQIPLNANEKLLIKGTNSAYGGTTVIRFNKFIATKEIKVEGNIMSLFYGDNFENQSTFTADYALLKLFYGCAQLIYADNLILPNTTRAYCYQGMFSGCSNLIKGPFLPATQLYIASYYEMFDSCTSLNYIKCLATNISANNSTKNWVRSVSATGTFIKNDTMNNWTIGADGIPTGWLSANNSQDVNAKLYNIPDTTGMVTSTTNGLSIEVVNSMPVQPQQNVIYIVL